MNFEIQEVLSKSGIIELTFNRAETQLRECPGLLNIATLAPYSEEIT